MINAFLEEFKTHNMYMKKLVNKIKNNITETIIFIVGIALRIFFALTCDINFSQHDVIGKNCHLEYARIIYEKGKLPMTNDWQFYQPPFNAFMQTLMVRIAKIFTGIKKFERLYQYCNILTMIYVILTFVFMYLILKTLCKNCFVKNTTFFILAIYPGLIFQATQYNNDPLATMFFFMSIYFAIRWCLDRRFTYAIILALSIGFGMLTKISVALVAFIIGPMMIIILIKDKSVKTFVQLVIFALIVFPLGLSFAIRNFLLFGQTINFVPKITMRQMTVSGYSAFERFLSFPITRFFNGKFGIYHDIKEYNIWVDLIKTATYDEADFSGTFFHIPCMILLIINILFSIFSVFATVFNLVTIKKYKGDNLLYMSYIMILISVVSFVIFNITHPVSCTSSYRYVSYATFAFAYMVSLFIDSFIKKTNHP